MIRTIALTLASLLVTPPTLAAEAGPESFKAQDLFGLQAASSPEISPDGKWLAYVRTTFDLATDKPERAIWLVNVASGEAHPISGGKGQQNPKWSPDGKRLAFVAPDVKGNIQINVYWTQTGAVRAVTDVAEAPGGITWSADGKQLYFSALLPTAPETFGAAPPAPDGAQWAPPLQVITDAYYIQDGGGYSKPGNAHLFCVSSEGGPARQLTSGAYNDGGTLSASPDGRFLVFASARKPGHELSFTDTDLFQLDLGSGNVRQLTDRIGPDEDPAVSPDGRMVAWTGYDEKQHGYDNYQLYVMPLEGGTPRLLTAALDRSTEQPKWAPDGRSVFVTSTDKGITRVLQVHLDGRIAVVARNLASTQMDRPYSQDGPYPEPRFSVSGSGEVATTRGGVDSPPDVVIAGKGGRTRQLTHLNPDLGTRIKLGAVKPLSVTSSFDGLLIDAWIVTPPNFDPTRKYPLILEIHGGPAASYGPNFGSQDQLYAAAGYVVLYANPRGSSSYGMDFALKGDKQFPGHDYEDLMSAVDAAVATGYVDAGNLFVTGGSGGGSLTTWIIGKTDRFKAAVAQKPAINWMSLLLTTDAYPIYWSLFAEKHPWEENDTLWLRSPLSLVGNVKTPTMLLVGDEDRRTPLAEAAQYYGALKLRGIPTALVLVPGASHDSLNERPSQQAASTATIIGWFDRYRTTAK
jgi:dipeptidyl aminopeptidase/acylaminoacyl peptidase